MFPQHHYDNIVSLSLDQNQEIINMKAIDNNRILINIRSNNEIQGIIFDVDKQEIIQKIKK